MHEAADKLGSTVTDNGFRESMGREDPLEENFCSVLCSVKNVLWRGQELQVECLQGWVWPLGINSTHRERWIE